jgi:nitrous oxide reductase accessory protein NosL
MKRVHSQGRREALRVMLAAGAATGLGALAPAAVAAAGCPGDGTPLQFQPKTAPDPEPRKNELEKYPKCPYCGMDRKQFNRTRHLIWYSDDRVDGTCSVHCTALALSVNMDLAPKAIYAADAGAKDEVKPLIDADKAFFLVGSKLPPVMSRTSKYAYASRETAEAVKAEQGGEVTDFDGALKASYLDMAADTAMIRKKREERRAKAAAGG